MFKQLFFMLRNNTFLSYFISRLELAYRKINWNVTESIYDSSNLIKRKLTESVLINKFLNANQSFISFQMNDFKISIIFLSYISIMK